MAIFRVRNILIQVLPRERLSPREPCETDTPRETLVHLYEARVVTAPLKAEIGFIAMFNNTGLI